MPTATGAETIGERLARLRADLARVRQVIERQETNGQSFNIGGTSINQIAYERAQQRRGELEEQIRRLEARAAGGAEGAPGLYKTVTGGMR